MERRNLLKMLPLTGVFSLVDFASAFGTDKCKTTSDILGPYYKPNAPFKTDISGDDPGPKLYISGTVYGADCISPVANAIVDVWQADSKAVYHETLFRAKIKTDENGHYAFLSVLPGKYLNGSTYRPRHLHYKIHADGIEYLTTQIYFNGDSSILQDPWASDPLASKRIISLEQDKEGAYHGIADITIEKDASLSVEDDSIANDSFSIFPIPVSGDTINIVFKTGSNGKIILTDINGKVLSNTIISTLSGQTITLNLIDSNGIRLARGLYAVYFVSAESNKTYLKRFVVS